MYAELEEQLQAGGVITFDFRTWHVRYTTAEDPEPKAQYLGIEYFKQLAYLFLNQIQNDYECIVTEVGTDIVTIKLKEEIKRHDY